MKNCALNIINDFFDEFRLKRSYDYTHTHTQTTSKCALHCQRRYSATRTVVIVETVIDTGPDKGLDSVSLPPLTSAPNPGCQMSVAGLMKHKCFFRVIE